MSFWPLSNGRDTLKAVITIAVVVLFSRCNRDTPSEISVEPASDAKQHTAIQEAQQARLPLCPHGHSESTPIPPNAMHHKVVLTWDPSASAGRPGNIPVGYCLYRTKQQILVKTLKDCKDCEQVSPKAILGTGCVDPIVQDGKTYFYVALTINPGDEKSNFSSQAMAVIPPDKESHGRPSSLPSCREQAPDQALESRGRP